jgi:hypothetical protein
MAEKKTIKTSPAKRKNVKAKTKPVAKKTAAKKAVIEKVPAIEIKPAKHRVPRKQKLSLPGLEELEKKQSELDAVKKGIKTKLRDAYLDLEKRQDLIRGHYQELFNESIENILKHNKRSSGKATKPAKRGAIVPYTKAEVSAFIEQKEQGIELSSIKIKGRRPKSIQKMMEAYEKADTKDSASVLAILR